LFEDGEPVDKYAAALVLAETVFMVRDYVKQNRHSTQVQKNTNKLLQSIGKRL
jgi:hypothetical protein